jgi:hypothetical protein
MIERGLIAEAAQLGCLLEKHAARSRKIGSMTLPPIGQRVSMPSGLDLDREIMAANVAMTTRACQKWMLQSSMIQSFNLEIWLRTGPPNATFLELAIRLDSLRQAIMDETVFRIYLAIPSELSQYVNQEKPLGDAVYNAFPSARADLSETGNCLACERNMGAAFHLMRAAEVGLWELGRDRQIPFVASGRSSSKSGVKSS